MPRHEDLISKLTEIVEVATTALRDNGEERHGAAETRNETSTRNSLRQLFPSIRSAPDEPSSSNSAIVRPRPRSSSSETPARSQHWNRVPPGPSSIPTYDSSKNYKCRSKSRSKKADSRQREKETVSYKDVFFLNDPDCSKVPQRNDRQFYYSNGLVGSAVAFSSYMREIDIRRAISSAIPRFQNTLSPDFVFVKAVGEKLVELSNIREWNYKILKQQTGQGPVYVRSKFFIDIGWSSSEETSGSIDHWIKAPCDVSSSDDEELLHSPIMPMSTTEKVKDSKQPTKTEERGTSKKHQCPVCLLFFEQQIIQSHTNDCLDERNPDARLYDDIMFDDDIEIISSHSEDEAHEKDKGNDQRTTCLPLDPGELKKRIKEKLKTLTVRVESNLSSRFNVRRKTLWTDYLEYRKKPWVSGTKMLHVIFVGEPAIDDGGPKREFFAGALEQMKRKLFKVTGSGSMIPIESCMAVANEEFRIAGELCSSSIAQGGPAPNFLAEWLYDFLAGGLKSIRFEKSTKLDDAALDEFRVKINNAESDEALQDFLTGDDSMDVLQSIGYMGNPYKEKLASKEKILQSLYHKYFLAPIHSAVHQFADGLKLFGVLNEVQLEPDVMRPVFTSSTCFKWQAVEFLQNLQVHVSDEGSNLYDKEVDTFKYFSDLVEQMSVRDAELGLYIEDLCKFITGSSSVPPLGLPNNISVTFKHGCLLGCKCRPTASTCALTLVLPCHANSMLEMQDLFTSALRDCHGFGRV